MINFYIFLNAGYREGSLCNFVQMVFLPVWQEQTQNELIILWSLDFFDWIINDKIILINSHVSKKKIKKNGLSNF